MPPLDSTDAGRPAEDRRKAVDRRGSDRQGKYDRRRNRCGLCVHFESRTTEAGYCRYHQVALSATDFACPQFEPR